MHTETTQLFTETLWQYYAEHSRGDLPWRRVEATGTFDPYKILVSELMLQQTQVARVIPKFSEFLRAFPTVESLAAAPLAAVLRSWSGLGYNRRAKFLWQAAQMIQHDMNGVFPDTVSELTRLPGVGKNTAGAIVAYAFNRPTVFIETNVRTVYIHHFFHDQVAVPDAAIQELVASTLDYEHPREFYWALMDYGSYLKQAVGNLSRHSKSYAKQSAFKGSKRQVRGQVLRELASGSKTDVELSASIIDDRLTDVLQDLLNENLIQRGRGNWHL